MEYFILILALFILAKCEGNIWSARPLYVVERFPLPDTIKNVKFPMKSAAFQTAPLEPIIKTKPSSTRIPTSEPTNNNVDVTPLPKLIKAIPKEHKAKIKALHTPCHKTGCVKGSQCVYDKMWMCPTYIPDLDCSCRPGCVVGNTFIAMGKALTMDECGNRCACQDNSGKAVCTKRSCTKEIENKEAKMDSLLKYLKKLVKITLQENEKPTEETNVQTSVSAPLETSASDNLLERKTSSDDIKMSPKMDFNIKTRFPYNPKRPLFVWT